MCRFSHIRLLPAEQKEVRKLSGVMIPIYASVALVLFAVAIFAQLPRADGEIEIAKNGAAPSSITSTQR
jgi:hypothetical protein